MELTYMAKITMFTLARWASIASVALAGNPRTIEQCFLVLSAVNLK
jgi:hypothetical protein